jgi:hypothetical protein
MQHSATYAHAQTNRSVNRQTCEIWRVQRGRREQARGKGPDRKPRPKAQTESPDRKPRPKAQTESPDRKPRPKAQTESPKRRPRARAEPRHGSTQAESSASTPHLAHSRTRLGAAPESCRHPTASGLQTQPSDTTFRHDLQTRPSDTTFRHDLAVTDTCSVFVSIQSSSCPPRPLGRISPKSSAESSRRTAATQSIDSRLLPTPCATPRARPAAKHRPVWRNWQTQRIQNPPPPKGLQVRFLSPAFPINGTPARGKESAPSRRLGDPLRASLPESTRRVAPRVTPRESPRCSSALPL